MTQLQQTQSSVERCTESSKLSNNKKPGMRKPKKYIEGRSQELTNNTLNPTNGIPREQNLPQLESHHHITRGIEKSGSRDVQSHEQHSSESNRKYDGRHSGKRTRQRNIVLDNTTAESSKLKHHGIVDASTTSLGLRATAPIFMPGEPVPHEKPQSRLLSSEKKNRIHKKEAENVMGRIHEALSNNSYECMICCDEIKRQQAVWSCKRCWAVFHIHCVDKWAKKSLEDGQSWRCPACQNLRFEPPGPYFCWCGKVEKPELNRYLVPHSCGEPCGKDRGCPHLCNLLCHPGPCPPCTAMGPVLSCFCGCKNSQKRCTETNYNAGWSCNEVCGEILACGHSCLKPCHQGFCGSCTLIENVICYCGKEKIPVMCGEQFVEQQSVLVSNGVRNEWVGKVRCDNLCGRLLECGIHRCSKKCHPQDEKPVQCSLSPKRISSCPCGATQLSELLPIPRKHCTDPVPTCQKQCNKLLDCGHSCKAVCHHGECPPCQSETVVRCRCGSTEMQTTCVKRMYGFQPECNTICRVLRNCGRHECGKKCCSVVKTASARIKGKNRVASSCSQRFEPEHLCTLVCNKSLSCGNHNCLALCHKGPCPSCLEATFEELSCHCGLTRLYPPIPCGTKLPLCVQPCQCETLCGHPRVSHECHPTNELCPPCPYLVDRYCTCGETVLKNVPCWRKSNSCSKPCPRKLACGQHNCSKVPCHKPEECQSFCRNLCGKPRKLCGHPCAELCHGTTECPEDIKSSCKTKIDITCNCGYLKQYGPCNTNTENTTSSWRKLSCCAMIERNRKLAQALTIDPDRVVTLDLCYNQEVLDYYFQNKVRACNIEVQFREFMQQHELQKLSFKPMKSSHRKFIHQLAESFVIKSESLDPEPYRSVVCQKTPVSRVPLLSLSAAWNAYKTQSKYKTPAVSDVNQPKNRPCHSKPFNSILLDDLKVGLLQEELDEILQASGLKFDILWIDGKQILLSPSITGEVEHELHMLKPLLETKLLTANLAHIVELAWVDGDGQIIYQESKVALNT